MSFPNRPNHPDFWEMAAAVQDIDSAADDGTSLERIVSVDLESLAYMAQQRALRLGGSPAVAAAWIDAFTAGALYGRRRAERDAQ